MKMGKLIYIYIKAYRNLKIGNIMIDSESYKKLGSLSKEFIWIRGKWCEIILDMGVDL